jgi:hypothetical protein
MPLSLRRGRVSVILDRHDELVRLEVDGVACIAYPRLTGPVEEGDDVVVNVQARELDLGSGGFDVLHANLTRGLGLSPPHGAHVMTLPYSPLQSAAPHAEEGAALASSLDGLPVVCCSLHSQLVPVCAALAGRRTAYLQLGGGALPVSLSEAVRALRGRGLLEIAVSVSPCFDGDVQCVNPWSALAWAKAQGFEVAVCAVGPGIVGTASRLGHGGLAAATAANAAAGLGGRAIVVARVSDADPRERHRGLSHHTRAVLDVCLGEPELAWPAGYADPPEGAVEVDAGDWRDASAGLPVSHMGRGPDDDPWFFAAAFAAGRLVAASG